MTRDAQLGTLRRRALDAARLLLEESGAEGLHLRTLAARVGSAVASLYYHFADKEALLAALAIEGWQELARRIDKAVAGGKFAHGIDAASAAYLAFIHRNPQLYALMQQGQTPEVRAAEQATLAVFRSSLDGDPRLPPERVEQIALLFWVLGRGIASAAQGEGDPKLVEKVLSGFGFLMSPRFVG